SERVGDARMVLSFAPDLVDSTAPSDREDHPARFHGALVALPHDGEDIEERAVLLDVDDLLGLADDEAGFVERLVPFDDQILFDAIDEREAREVLELARLGEDVLVLRIILDRVERALALDQRVGEPELLACERGTDPTGSRAEDRDIDDAFFLGRRL